MRVGAVAGITGKPSGFEKFGGDTSREIKIVLCETMLSLKRVLSSDNKNIKTQSFELRDGGYFFFGEFEAAAKKHNYPQLVKKKKRHPLTFSSNLWVSMFFLIRLRGLSF